MRFLTKFAIAIIGWNFLPPAEAPAQVVPTGQTFDCTPTAVWDGEGPSASIGRSAQKGRTGKYIRRIWEKS